MTKRALRSVAMPVNNAAGLCALLAGKRTLIFDFDGTVADTAPLHAKAFQQTLAPLGITVNYPSIAGLRTNDAIELCLQEAGLSPQAVDLPALIAEKQDRARRSIAHELQPKAGVDAFLVWARPRFRLAMVTSGSRATVEAALEKLGHFGWFDPLICSEDVRRAKPAPDGFFAALDATRSMAEDMLVFEDSSAGFHAAAAAGLAYVDVTKLDWREALECSRLTYGN